MANGNGYQQGLDDRGSRKPIPVKVGTGTSAEKDNYLKGRFGK